MKTYSCQQCGKENIFKYGHSANKFCSFECAKDSQRSATFNKIVEGRVSDRGLIRKNLIWKFGRKCYECGLEEWRGHPIPIEVDHVDGNAGNNDYLNLRLLCPNCHGITPTWKGRNKGNGRAARGLPLN
jgi:hypothetical protein